MTGPVYERHDIVERPAETAGLVGCRLCEAGFRRAVGGVHVGSQRKGMIPNQPCERVFAAHGGVATEINAKPYLAYVDGAPIKNADGVPRRFGTARTAFKAAQRAAPYVDHR